MSNKIILASQSPRRNELLQMLGIDFTIYPADIHEKKITAKTTEELAERIALKKAAFVSRIFPEDIIIGADTIVVCENRTLGKPENDIEAIEMLKYLSGKKHFVITGLVIIGESKNIKLAGYEKTYVTMKKLKTEEIISYVEDYSPLDKAGAYAIQDGASEFISKVEGCYYNIVGLPLKKLAKMFKKIEIEIPEDTLLGAYNNNDSKFCTFDF